MNVLLCVLLCYPLPFLEKPAPPKTAWEKFEPSLPKDGKPFAGKDLIDSLNAALPDEYVLGPGDVVDIQVWKENELSGPRTIGPDGKITLPLVGDLKLGELPRSKALELVTSAFAKFYKNPIVTMELSEYHNNNVFVLGQLATPGLIKITGRGTLLEAITQATLSPGNTSGLTKCAVIRGNDKIVWVNVQEMIQAGNLDFNLKLANNDVIYLPHEEEALVYIMGEVVRPGAYRLKPGMSFLDGLMTAGGATVHGKKNKIMLVRATETGKQLLRVKTSDLVAGDLSRNVTLAENDIIYVGRRPLARLQYMLSSLTPFASLVVLSEAVGLTNNSNDSNGN